MALPGASAKSPVQTAPSGLTRAAPVLGISLKLASTLVFTIMMAMLKIAAETVPVGEIVFARNFFGMFPVLIMVAFRGELAIALKTSRPLSHLGRSSVGISAMILSFTGFSLLPLPDATAIGFATPLFVVVLAWLVLHETVRLYRWSAVVIGFFGILIILSPHMGQGDVGSGQMIGAVCAALAAVFAALAMIFVRRLCETERTTTIVTWFSGSATLLALLTIPLGFIFPDQAWVMPDGDTAFILMMVGLAGGVGQILLTQSYRFADASTIAPFDYANMIWAVILGYFLFAEVPVWQVLVGAAIVIAAGIFVIYREHRLGIDRTKARRASTPSKS
ncbi:DMT family transporter [Roseibium aggregatum]|uniref:DMT family transporter n=1 Tax=Roseibium aggregatum TaxID=187304 RepID=A0A926S9Z4_9HYPH|nr:DMT family transporter [Roseibium aggregatum]MBD1547869.1 DMT family transporter [Roseibium aggregatum]